MRLPRSLDDLTGLRAARWVRESTRAQEDRFGPEAQREQQDRALERYGLVDTGIAWQVAHSGRSIAETAAFADMLASAGVTYDVLLVGYVSRFARDLETAVVTRRRFHAAGAALLFCDERVLSSDEDQWETWAREALEAEAYSRRLARRVSEGYAAKFRRHADPGGNAPLGFRRVGGRLQVDSATIDRAVGIFTRYASGTVSMPALEAETGVDHEAIKVMLRNPIYNGWVRRHPRGEKTATIPAPWRHDPPVSDALWDRVQQAREDRDTGGGRSTRRHVHLLAGVLFCPCGARLRAEAVTKSRRWVFRRYRHGGSCPRWTQGTRIAHVLEDPISAQVEQLRLGAGLMTNLRRLHEVRAPGPQVASIRRRQLERDLDDLARRHARRTIATDAYLVEHARLAARLDEPAEVAEPPVVSPERAIAWLRDMRALWRATDDEGRRGLVAAIYERVTATSDGVIGVRFTEAAQRHGIALAAPEAVVLARPEGLEPRRAIVPIEGRREWLRAVRSA